MAAQPVTVRPDSLKSFAATALTRVGVPPDQAAEAADVLVWANLHGIDTHGVRNLKRSYVDPLAKGRIKPVPAFCIEQETSVTARVDGDQGLGLVAGPWAMRLAMAKARDHGLGMVVVRNSHHFGAAGYHAMLAVAEDMIGISLTGRLLAEGVTAGVVPTFGKTPRLSTNPISVACPAGVEPAFLLDMATSIAPMNRIWLYQETSRTLPLGWGLDEAGQPTTDPAALRHLLPLGGTREMGGHKGYALALVVEILCALLSGGWDRNAEGKFVQTGDGHFFGAIRVDAFRAVTDFKDGMDALIQSLHATEPLDPAQPVLVPGEPEAKARQARSQTGIPLAPNVVEDIRDLAARYDIPLPFDGD
jgi:LDH2 family malate/lactate/ureidoglycolate dehydrogenase